MDMKSPKTILLFLSISFCLLLFSCGDSIVGLESNVPESNESMARKGNVELDGRVGLCPEHMFDRSTGQTVQFLTYFLADLTTSFENFSNGEVQSYRIYLWEENNPIGFPPSGSNYVVLNPDGSVASGSLSQLVAALPCDFGVLYHATVFRDVLYPGETFTRRERVCLTDYEMLCQ